MCSKTNPFVDIYKSCNTGTNEDKYGLILDGKVTIPRYLDVELTNFCNFNCCFCPTGTKAMNRTRGYMEADVIQRIIEDCLKFGIPAVRFIRWGEPTMHPEFLDIMKKFKDAGILVHINTNGSIEEETAKALVDLEIDSIKFSFQGADEGTYNEMRQGGQYNRLLEIVRKMYEYRGVRELPYIQITTTITYESDDQIRNFENDVKFCCDYYNIGYTKLNHLNVDAMDISDEQKDVIRRLKEQERNSHKRLDVCVEAFDKLSINWNGDITLCCADYDNFMVVGNILDNDIKTLFNSRAADNYRQIILKGQFGRIKCCRNCYEIVPLR